MLKILGSLDLAGFSSKSLYFGRLKNNPNNPQSITRQAPYYGVSHCVVRLDHLTLLFHPAQRTGGEGASLMG